MLTYKLSQNNLLQRGHHFLIEPLQFDCHSNYHNMHAFLIHFISLGGGAFYYFFFLCEALFSMWRAFFVLMGAFYRLIAPPPLRKLPRAPITTSVHNDVISYHDYTGYSFVFEHCCYCAITLCYIVSYYIVTYVCITLSVITFIKLLDNVANDNVA